MDSKQQERLKGLSKNAASKVPYVGAFASLIIDVSWTIREKSLWEQIEKEVAAYVAKAIFDDKLRILRTRLEAYGNALREIELYTKGATRYRLLLGLRSSISLDIPFYMNKEGDGEKIAALLPLWMPLAVVHVAVANMVANEAAIIPGDTYSGPAIEDSETNRAANWKILENLQQEYHAYAQGAVPPATKWRMSLVEVKHDSSQIQILYAPGPATHHDITCYDHHDKIRYYSKSLNTGLGQTNTLKDVSNAMAEANVCKDGVRTRVDAYWKANVLDVVEPWKPAVDPTKVVTDTVNNVVNTVTDSGIIDKIKDKFGK